MNRPHEKNRRLVSKPLDEPSVEKKHRTYYINTEDLMQGVDAK